ncbi:MAG: hypothetical protein HY832_03100 [Candidatus Aenigmarchaeota archaeon]|nr:hypothetical protein [Candidatus Aenigmarchaeota archaeon]
MSIDTSLTYQKARDQVGRVLPVTGEYKEYLAETFPAQDGTYPREFKNQQLPENYEGCWTFDQQSKLVLACKDFNELRQNTTIRLDDTDFIYASSALLTAFCDTKIPALCYGYQHERFRVAEHKTEAIFFDLFAEQEDGYTSCQSISEGIYNALEHGTRYCTQGNVDVDIMGGENGLLVTIAQPSNSFDLRPYSSEELRRINEKFKQKNGNARNAGIKFFMGTKKAIIGSEREDDHFRLIVIYPIPTRNEIEAYQRYHDRLYLQA